MAESTLLDLWERAGRDTDTYEAHVERYHELMREHGLLVPREPGDDGNLPCGWPGRGDGSDGE